MNIGDKQKIWLTQQGDRTIDDLAINPDGNVGVYMYSVRHSPQFIGLPFEGSLRLLKRVKNGQSFYFVIL